MELIELELKYCERCGSLWVRETGTGEIFCFPCAEDAGLAQSG